MFIISRGISSIVAKPIASPLSAIPGPEEVVTPKLPANEAPIAEHIPAISSSAWKVLIPKFFVFS